MDIIPYADLSDGNEYFATKLNSEYWDEANNDKRFKALCEATRLINNLRFNGETLNQIQTTLFPRRFGSIIIQTMPQQIVEACLEIALALLDDTLDMELEIEGLSDINIGFASVKTDKNPNIYQEHLRAGIPSYRAWQLLKPYLVDPRVITLR